MFDRVLNTPLVRANLILRKNFIFRDFEVSDSYEKNSYKEKVSQKFFKSGSKYKKLKTTNGHL